jgi:Uma2 family endonuclease
MENSEVKEAAPKYNYYSVEDYLALERTPSTTRYELHEGYLIVMQGASFSHVRICGNLMIDVGHFLRGKTCDIFSNDLKTGILSKESIVYPDLIITCEPPLFHDNEKDVLLNPAVIMEIFSPSTEEYDRGNKFFYYRQLASLREYILIGSTGPYIYTARKQQNGQWVSEETNNPDALLTIETIGYTLPLSEVYHKVSF